MAGAGASKPGGTPIKKKRAPLSARGRIQDSSDWGEAMEPPALEARARGRPSSAHARDNAYQRAYEHDVPEELRADEAPAERGRRISPTSPQHFSISIS